MADYKWTYASIGGSTRVKIQSGEDIRHLGELDEKLWTVLSCPTSGLEIDEASLKLMDTDGDGKLHVQEVVKTANWLCATLTDADILLKGEDKLNVADIKDEAIRVVAEKIATDGVVTLDAVRAAIGAVTIEAQPVPEAPYSGEVTAAYKACKDAYSQYFATARMQALGLATLPADAAVPGMTEEAFNEMGKAIADYEAGKAAAEGANAKALADAQAQYRPLEKLLLLTRDFYTLLRNFVSFQDFYAKRNKLGLLGRGAADEAPWAIFQAGTLVIDQRACNLCMRVADAGKHNTQAPASGMFLVYCNCTYKPTGQAMQIVAAVTVGDIKNLKVGKNALFYDRQGRDWDAEVTKIVDNPISIGQAFWSPYRKLGDWVTNLINKSAAEKETKAFSDMTTKIQSNVDKPAEANAPEKMQAFDIAKFAGIFAAIGMAVGYIGSFFTSLATGIKGLGWWQSILALIALLLVVSGPSMVLAWLKLRKRNLAPLLNANGWAINADALVNAMFGSSLTEQAQFPMMKLVDPHQPIKKISAGGKWAIAISIIVAILAVAALIFWLLGYNVCLWIY